MRGVSIQALLSAVWKYICKNIAKGIYILEIKELEEKRFKSKLLIQ